MAEVAYLMGSEHVADVPGPGIWTTAYGVTDVEERPTTPGLEREVRLNPPRLPPLPPFDVPTFSAEFRTYTIFGIPSGTASITCEESRSRERSSSSAAAG